jgi:hypothetical protein
MDSAVKTLKAALEAIRNTALNALNEIEQSQEQCSMRWKCKDCPYVSISQCLFPWKSLADAPDVKAPSLDLLCETSMEPGWCCVWRYGAVVALFCYFRCALCELC